MSNEDYVPGVQNIFVFWMGGTYEYLFGSQKPHLCASDLKLFPQLEAQMLTTKTKQTLVWRVDGVRHNDGFKLYCASPGVCHGL